MSPALLVEACLAQLVEACLAQLVEAWQAHLVDTRLTHRLAELDNMGRKWLSR